METRELTLPGGRWNEAEKAFLQVMETRMRVLGPEHPDTLISMNILALTYWDKGRWDEAEELNVQVMETRKMVLGPEHPEQHEQPGVDVQEQMSVGRG